MRRGVAVAVVALVVLIVVGQSLYSVDMTNQAIIVQFGEYRQTVTQPGMHFKVPFVQTAIRLEKRVLMSDAPPTGYLTMDKKNLLIDHVTRWRIVDPNLFFKSVSTELRAQQRLQAIVVSELRDEVASHDFGDMISLQREPIMEAVAERSGVKAREFGMEILDVRIKRADLPKEVQGSVFDRMRAERQRISKQNRAEGEEQAFKTRAEADRQATVILAEAFKRDQELRGEGDAVAMAIYAASYRQDPEFYSLLRTLEAYSQILDGDTKLVLGSDSQLFRLLSGPDSEDGSGD